jgi:hypothetical protein
MKPFWLYIAGTMCQKRRKYKKLVSVSLVIFIRLDRKLKEKIMRTSIKLLGLLLMLVLALSACGEVASVPTPMPTPEPPSVSWVKVLPPLTVNDSVLLGTIANADSLPTKLSTSCAALDLKVEGSEIKGRVVFSGQFNCEIMAEIGDYNFKGGILQLTSEPVEVRGKYGFIRMEQTIFVGNPGDDLNDIGIFAAVTDGVDVNVGYCTSTDEITFATISHGTTTAFGGGGLFNGMENEFGIHFVEHATPVKYECDITMEFGILEGSTRIDMETLKIPVIMEIVK